MTNKQADKKLQYSVVVVVVLIGILYVVSTLLGKGIKAEDNKMVALTPVVEETATAPVDADHMYLGMKTWSWVKAKGADGKVVTPAGEKPFTLAFDFNSGKFAIGTDCNSGSGLFSAKSGVVQFGNVASTKMACEGSQEGVFTDLLASSQKFYFTSKGEMVLTTKDGGTVTFK